MPKSGSLIQKSYVSSMLRRKEAGGKKLATFGPPEIKSSKKVKTRNSAAKLRQQVNTHFFVSYFYGASASMMLPHLSPRIDENLIFDNIEKNDEKRQKVTKKTSKFDQYGQLQI